MSDQTNKPRPNSSYASASLLLGISVDTIEICMPMLKYIDSLDSHDKDFWKKASENCNKTNNAQAKTID